MMARHLNEDGGIQAAKKLKRDCGGTLTDRQSDAHFRIANDVSNGLILFVSCS